MVVGSPILMRSLTPAFGGLALALTFVCALFPASQGSILLQAKIRRVAFSQVSRKFLGGRKSEGWLIIHGSLHGDQMRKTKEIDTLKPSSAKIVKTMG